MASAPVMVQRMPSLERHPRLELLYGARYSPHDNPVGGSGPR
jgi:hypothetical protein